MSKPHPQNDLRKYLKASGHRILAGVSGQVYGNIGKVVFEKAPEKGIDQHLFALLQNVVDDLAIAIEVNSIDTGAHVEHSRHYDGRAADINHIGPMGHDHPQATLTNPSAVLLLHHLVKFGWVAGHERTGEAAVLLGPAHTAWNETNLDHSTHIHISIAK